MPNSPYSINLAKDKQLPIIDRFLNWALSTGRLIVILTEIIAVIAFVYRFSLDEKIVDLHSSIKQKQNIVSALKSDENKYRNLQSRISIAKTFSARSTKTSQTIAEITSLIPNQIIINNLLLNKDKISLDLNVPSVNSLSQLIESLKDYKRSKSLSIENIENRPSMGISVNITMMLK